MRHHSRSGRKIMGRIAADIRPDRARILSAAVLVTASRLCLWFPDLWWTASAAELPQRRSSCLRGFCWGYWFSSVMEWMRSSAR